MSDDNNSIDTDWFDAEPTGDAEEPAETVEAKAPAKDKTLKRIERALDTYEDLLALDPRIVQALAVAFATKPKARNVALVLSSLSRVQRRNAAAALKPAAEMPMPAAHFLALDEDLVRTVVNVYREVSDRKLPAPSKDVRKATASAMNIWSGMSRDELDRLDAVCNAIHPSGV